MQRLYLVDSYNVILQDPELNEVLDYEGLGEARRAMKEVAGDFARRTGCRVRLVFDGSQDPFSHIESSEDQWVEVSFTSKGEKADERLVAIALESRRRGIKPTIVSDDIEGIREPLGDEGFALLSTSKFVRMMRSANVDRVEPRAQALSEESKRHLETEFLARDADNRRRKDEEKKALQSRREALRTAAAEKAASPNPPATDPLSSSSQGSGPGSPGGAVPGTMRPARGTAPAATGAASSSTPLPVNAPHEPDPARKARGQRKQERRLALLQSRRSKKK